LAGRRRSEYGAALLLKLRALLLAQGAEQCQPLETVRKGAPTEIGAKLSNKSLNEDVLTTITVCRSNVGDFVEIGEPKLSFLLDAFVDRIAGVGKRN
jgi:hypothetical protein